MKKYLFICSTADFTKARQIQAVCVAVDDVNYVIIGNELDNKSTAAIGRAKCYDADIIVNGLLDAVGIGEAASQQGKDTKQRKIDERKKHAS